MFNSAISNNDNSKNIRVDIIKFLIVSTQIAILLIAIVLFIPSSYRVWVYGILQVLLPTLCLLFTIKLYNIGDNGEIKRFALVLSVALTFWIFSNFMWELFPLMYRNDLLYYGTGFGWLFSYILIAIFLFYLKRNSKLALNPLIDKMLSVAGSIMTASILLIILLNLDWASPRKFDILILLGYLVADIAILTLSIKLAISNSRYEMKFLFVMIMVFFLFNMSGDLLFEVKYLFKMKFGTMTDIVYTMSMIFLASSLWVYTSQNVHYKAFNEAYKKFMDTTLKADDIIMQFPEAVAVFDNKGDIIKSNDIFLKIFNIKTEGRLQFNIFSHFKSSNSIDQTKFEVLKYGIPLIIRNLKMPVIKENKNINISLKVFPTLNSENEISGYVMIAEDITDKVKLENELKGAYDELKEKYDRRLDFTNMAAHELRTPLTPIIGYSEILKHEIKDDRLRDYVAAIEKNALLQKQTINNILEMSATDDGNINSINKLD